MGHWFLIGFIGISCYFQTPAGITNPVHSDFPCGDVDVEGAVQIVDSLNIDSWFSFHRKKVPKSMLSFDTLYGEIGNTAG